MVPSGVVNGLMVHHGASSHHYRGVNVISAPIETGTDMSNISNWIVAGLAFLHFLFTLFIATWRGSAAILEQKQSIDAEMAEYKIATQQEFAKLNETLIRVSGDIRHEFGTTVTVLRSHMSDVQSGLNDRINKLEVEVTRDYIRKDAFYSVIKDLTQQNRENFIEIKEQLRRLETKLDSA